MTPEAGKLTIRLSRVDGAIRTQVDPPPGLPLEQFLNGRMPEEAATLVPLIYNICAAAQEAAVRSALGLEVPKTLDRRVAVETLREHVVKLCMVWPPLLGQPAGREAMGHAARAFDDPAAAEALRRAIFAPMDGAPGSKADLESWMRAGETAPARGFAALVRDWDAGWGRADLALLDTAHDADWPYATQDSRAVENAPACRLTDSDLMHELAEARGHGLLWRMAARLVEVDRLLSGNGPLAVAAPGVANAARGAMMVRAEAGDDGVSAFSRLSPTDFALAPGGVLERTLETLPADRNAPLRAVAQMVIETVDPCVATGLEVADA